MVSRKRRTLDTANSELPTRRRALLLSSLMDLSLSIIGRITMRAAGCELSRIFSENFSLQKDAGGSIALCPVNAASSSPFHDATKMVLIRWSYRLTKTRWRQLESKRLYRTASIYRQQCSTIIHLFLLRPRTHQVTIVSCAPQLPQHGNCSQETFTVKIKVFL